MLATKGTRFLTGDTMCCFDCELMPKLQHIRVAGETLHAACSAAVPTHSHVLGITSKRDNFHLSSLTRKRFLSEYLKTRESHVGFDI